MLPEERIAEIEKDLAILKKHGGVLRERAVEAYLAEKPVRIVCRRYENATANHSGYLGYLVEYRTHIKMLMENCPIENAKRGQPVWYSLEAKIGEPLGNWTHVKLIVVGSGAVPENEVRADEWRKKEVLRQAEQDMRNIPR